MKEILTATGYNQTKIKLARLEQRLCTLDGRKDLSPQHLSEVQRSCRQMIAQYRRELKLYEAAHPETTATT